MQNDTNNTDTSQLQATTQNINGSAGTTFLLTPEADKKRIHLVVPPGTAIPVVFLPGIMGSNLRMSRARQERLKRKDNRAWRPDDAGDTAAKRDAPPRQRQLNFDPDQTEVEVYKWTSDGSRFDVEAAQDQRHSNVPHGLADINPLIRSDPLPSGPFAKSDPSKDAVVPTTAAQKARRRGWSELMFGSYGAALQEFEVLFNNVVGLTTQQLDAKWQQRYQDKAPAQWGQEGSPKPALTEAELKTLGNAWLPVHAMGYNWLKSNGESAKWVAQRIRDLKKQYENFGFECPGVIVVTHSMGGLVARALLHPKYGALKGEVLGVVHSAQPVRGAGASYTRMRSGFEKAGRTLNPIALITNPIQRKVLGANGADVTAVLANSPGALELLPHPAYGGLQGGAMGAPGAPWLVVKDITGATLAQWPRANGASLKEVYTSQAWWRLMNPQWVDPANKYKGKIDKAMKSLTKRLEKAMKFATDLTDTWHPQTYAHYGADARHPSYGQVVWQVARGDTTDAGPPEQWALLADAGHGELTVRSASGRELRLRLLPPQDAGDGTVPAQASGARLGIGAQAWAQTGYDHQGSYQNTRVQHATVFAVARMAAKALNNKA